MSPATKSKPKLNPKATQEADQQLYSAHPELHGRKLTNSPEDAALRKEWTSNYKKTSQKSANAPGDNKMGNSTLPCGKKISKNGAAVLPAAPKIPKSEQKSNPSDSSKTRVCNLTSLEITDSTSKRSVKLTTNEPVRPNLPLGSSKLGLVSGCAAVLEVLSAFPVEGAAPPAAKTVARISTVEKRAGQCGDHPAFYEKVHSADVTPGDTLRETHIARNTTPSVAIYGKNIEFDRRNGLLWMNIIDFFRMDESQVKELSIEAMMCGVPAGSEKACASLLGVVRVYRLEDFTLSLTVPALRKYEEKREGSQEYGKEWQYKGEKSRGDTSTKSEYTDEGVQKITESKRMVLVEKSFETSRDKDPKDETERKLEFSLKRNGTELPATEIINSILKQTHEVTENVLTAITSFEKAIPKIGYSISASFSLLEGTLLCNWGQRPDSRYDTDAFKLIGPYGDLVLDITVAKLEATGMVGVEFSSPAIMNWAGNKAYEFIAKIAFEASLTLKLKTSVTLWGGSEDLDPSKERSIVKNNIPAEIDVYLQFKVSVYGYALDARSGFTTGIEAEAEFVIPPKLKYKLDLKAGIFYGYWNCPGKGEPSPRHEYKMWEDRPLTHGEFPKDSEPAALEA